ncbi:MAG: beta-ketoacyl-ACP synthase II [Candidatus Riflebacteria bacterium]|nr:beta-ketoacyl-ACP synthase II [Candidatus Riflebacteria bacterium]
MNRVFVTGMGVVSPVGIGIEAFQNSLREGKNGIARLTSFDASKHSVKIAAEVKDFDPTFAITKKDVRRHDRYSQFSMATAKMAVQQAAIDPAKIDPDSVGVIVATGIGGIHSYETEFEVLTRSGPGRVSPFLVPMMICNIASGYIAMEYGFRGPNYAVVSACASGLHAIGEAFLKLATGMLDIVVCGGTESAITSLTVAGFAQMKALSTRNDEPERASRPFDRDRDGFVMGEGSAVFVLETEESMKRRGVDPMAEIAGYGASADAYHLTAPHPQGLGAKSAMLQAIKFSKTPIQDVDYVNAHGTSTPIGDPAEVNAMKETFGTHSGKIVVNSTKSMIGHLLGAAGSVGLAATILQMRGGFVHPTLNLENPGEGCDLDFVPLKAREQKIKCGIVNSFGFGGQNASILVKSV